MEETQLNYGPAEAGMGTEMVRVGGEKIEKEAFAERKMGQGK